MDDARRQSGSMAILNVNATLDPVWGGGGAERTRRLSSALARQGHRVTVLTIASDTPGADQVAGAQVVSLERLNKRFMVPLIRPGRLRDLIRQHDVVHLNGHWTLLNAVVYLLARQLGKPHVVSPVGTLPVFGRSRRIKQWYNRLVGRSMIRNAQAHVAVTATESPQFAEYGVDPAGVTVIPNGVDADAFGAADAAGFRARNALAASPFIMFVGRLNPIKGPDLLLEAFAQVAQDFPSWLLVLAGPDEGMGDGLRAEAQRRGIADRVRLIGYVGGSEKVAAYRAANLLAIPSRQEAMSIVVLEAGAAATPVLITDQCGFDMVEETGGGMVVAASAPAIAQGLRSMLSSAERLPQMGLSLQTLVQNEFTWDVAASRLGAVFMAARAKADQERMSR
jgi:glycosyltransferase involved in cell wall biosynthesis